MKKILVIANLKAGRAKLNKKIIKKIVENFKNKKMDVLLEYTSVDKSATEIVLNHNGQFDILCVCGGDGTLNQIVQAFCRMNIKIPIAYIPTGTTNDFARNLELPFNKLELSKNIDKYVEKDCDIGIFNDKYFDYVASIGLFSKTSYATNYKTKNRFGRLGYLFLGTKEVFENKSFKLKLICNSEEVEDEFIYGSVSNSAYIGGFHLFKKEDIDCGDGKFEVVFAKKPRTFLGKVKLLFKVLAGDMYDENLYYFRTSNLKIESEVETEWSIDGEYSGKIKNVEISNMKQKIKFLVPKPEEN